MFRDVQTAKAAAGRRPPTVGDYPYLELNEVPVDDAGRYHLYKTVGVRMVGGEIIDDLSRQLAKGKRRRDDFEVFVKFEVPNVLADEFSQSSLNH